MDFIEAARARHSVRAYQNRPIEDSKKALLEGRIADINARSGLKIALVTDEPKAFGTSIMAHYGKFENADNYFALVGERDDGRLHEKCGYFGEELVLFAQTLGLNTCWVALTYKKIKGALNVGSGQKLAAVIAVGYGKTQGRERRSKSYGDVARAEGPVPEWFERGVGGALLAPTAMNQQKFTFTLRADGKVLARAGAGFYAKMDLGIAKYHFELFAGSENFEWEK